MIVNFISLLVLITVIPCIVCNWEKLNDPKRKRITVTNGNFKFPKFSEYNWKKRDTPEKTKRITIYGGDFDRGDFKEYNFRSHRKRVVCTETECKFARDAYKFPTKRITIHGGDFDRGDFKEYNFGSRPWKKRDASENTKRITIHGGDFDRGDFKEYNFGSRAWKKRDASKKTKRITIHGGDFDRGDFKEYNFGSRAWKKRDASEKTKRITIHGGDFDRGDFKEYNFGSRPWRKRADCDRHGRRCNYGPGDPKNIYVGGDRDNFVGDFHIWGGDHDRANFRDYKKRLFSKENKKRFNIFGGNIEGSKFYNYILDAKDRPPKPDMPFTHSSTSKATSTPSSTTQKTPQQ